MGKMKSFGFNRSVTPLRDKMFRFAQSILLSRDEAEDVTHDLLERLWCRQERLAECRNLDAFVMTAVRNACCDRLRSREAAARHGEEWRRTVAPVGESAAEGWELREMVRRAIARLPERQREAVHLKDIEGYETHEVAELLAADDAQVRVLLSRARRRLREIIEEMMEYETKR